MEENEEKIKLKALVQGYIYYAVRQNNIWVKRKGALLGRRVTAHATSRPLFHLD